MVTTAWGKAWMNCVLISGFSVSKSMEKGDEGTDMWAPIEEEGGIIAYRGNEVKPITSILLLSFLDLPANGHDIACLDRVEKPTVI